MSPGDEPGGKEPPMMTGDEFFGDEITSPRDASAFLREWERANPTCLGCGFTAGAQCRCDDLDDTYDRDYEYFQYAEAA